MLDAGGVLGQKSNVLTSLMTLQGFQWPLRACGGAHEPLKAAGPLEPLEGPGDLERPPGIILTPAHPLQAAARRCAGLGTDRPLRGGRQAGGSRGKTRRFFGHLKIRPGCWITEKSSKAGWG